MAVKRVWPAHSRSGKDTAPPAVPERRRWERRGEACLPHERENRLRFAAQAAGFGIFDLDCHNGDVHLSPELQAMSGVPPGCHAFPEARIDEFLHPDDRMCFRQKFAASRDPRGSGEFEDECRVLLPGGMRWVRIKGRTFFAGEGEERRSLGACGVVMDITEQKCAEAALRQEAAERKRLEEELRRINGDLERRIAERTAELARANEALVRSNLDLQQFAYIAAHDLQTPLRSITGFAQLLQQECRGNPGGQTDTWINQLVEYTKRMHALIQDLLEYSRVDSRGRAFLPVDLGRVFDEVLQALEPAILDSGARVTRDALPLVLGDRVQLGQVLQNLLENGIKYHGAAPPRVHVTAERKGREWLISVSDNGIGIANQHRERIFEIFRRLHTQQEYPGTGIGLAVCRRVIHRHGGRIWVVSEPGAGSVFHFTLPARKAAAA